MVVAGVFVVLVVFAAAIRPRFDWKRSDSQDPERDDI